MKVKTSYKEIWGISYPIMLGALATTVLNLTDTAFMARVGQVELAAMAIASIFHLLLYMIGFALSTGAQILIARRAGEDNRNEIGVLFNHTFLLLLGLGFITFFISLFLSPGILNLILRSDGVAQASIDYVQIRSLGLLIGTVGLVFRSFFVGIGRTNIITSAAIVMIIVNIVLDFFLVLGYGGFTPMGIKGAAWATVIAEVLSVIVISVYPFFKAKYKVYQLFKFETQSSKKYNSILKISSPIIFQNIISMTSWFIFFVLIEKMGERELAISNIARAVYMVLMTPIWGFASAANSMVSNIIGQGKINEVKSLVIKIMSLCLFTTSLFVLADYMAGPFLLQLTSSDSQLVEDSMGVYHVIIIAMIIFSMSIILLSAVSGTGNTMAALVIEIINISIYLLYVYLCTIFSAKIEVTWLAEIIYWTFMGLFSLIYFKYYNWKSVII